MKKYILRSFCALLSLLMVVSCEKDYPPTNDVVGDQTVSFSTRSVDLRCDNSEQKYVVVSAGNDVAWRVKSNAEWLTLSVESSGVGYSYASGRGERPVYLIATDYDGGDGEPRVAKVTLSGSTQHFVVKQYPSGEIETSVPSITFGKGESTRTMSVGVKDSSKEWTLKAVDAATNEEIDWVNLTAVAARSSVTGKGTQDVSVAVEANSGAARNAKVMLGEEELFAVAQTDTDFFAVESLSVSESTRTMDATTSAAMGVTINPNNATDTYIRYESSDPSVATVAADGTISALAVGSATIKAIAGDYTNDAKTELALTVVAATPVESVSFAAKTLTIGIGDDPKLISEATILPENATNQKITYSVDKPANATINASTGELTGLVKGVVTVTATTEDGAKTATQTVYVITRVAGVEITGAGVAEKKVDVALGGETVFTSSVTPTDASNLSATWSVEGNDGEVETTENEDGTISLKGIAAGEVTLTATSVGDTTKSDSITITIKPIILTAISIADITLPLGESIGVAVNYTPANPSVTGVEYKYSTDNVIEIEDGEVSIVDGETPDVGTEITVTATSLQEGDTPVTTTFKVTIAPEIPKYAVGDKYPNADSPIGVVYWVDPDDATKGKVVSYGQSAALMWSSDTTSIGATSSDDGAANTKNVLESASYSAEKYPGFAWLKENYIDNKEAVGNLDWYIPSITELKELLITVYDYTDATAAAAWLGDTKSAQPNPALTKTNLNTFNAKYFTNASDPYKKFALAYWCSTEGKLAGTDADTYSRMFATGGGNIQDKAKSFNASAQFRAIAKFGYSE